MSCGCNKGMAGVRKPKAKKAKKCIYLVGSRAFRTKKAATRQAKRTGGTVKKSCAARASKR